MNNNLAYILGGNLPLIEMSFGKGALTAEQKINLARKVADLVAKETNRPKEAVWVVTHEEPLENWLVGGLTVEEFNSKLMQEKK